MSKLNIFAPHLSEPGPSRYSSMAAAGAALVILLLLVAIFAWRGQSAPVHKSARASDPAEEFWSTPPSAVLHAPVRGEVGVLHQMRAPVGGAYAAQELEDLNAFVSALFKMDKPAVEAMLSAGRIFWLNDDLKVKVLETKGGGDVARVVIIDGADPALRGRTGWVASAWLIVPPPLTP